jgi:hypothetical protein
MMDDSENTLNNEEQTSGDYFPTLSECIDYYEAYVDETKDAQSRSRQSREYYDNIQWKLNEIKKLEERGQPVVTKNYIARKIDYILGEEIRKRIDPVTRPRTPQEDDSARASTDALRYAEEEQMFDVVRSSVLKNILIEGFGGAVKSLEEVYETVIDEQSGERSNIIVDYKHVLAHVEWDRLFYDPSSRKVDFSDAKYKGIVIWLDLSDAIERYPNSSADLEAAVARSDSHDTLNIYADTPRDKKWADCKRKRVKIIEMYYKIGGDWYRIDFTKNAVLRDFEPTFIKTEKGNHTVCPLEMESCYVDSNGYRYGVVERLKSAQEEINKRTSKALHLLSVDRTTYENGAIEDINLYQSERAKPDGAMLVADGALIEGRVRNESGMELAQGQILLLNEAKNDINSIGPSSSVVGDLPGGISGRAFIARQNAASMELGTVFDQLKNWSHRIFTLDWLCIRQFWTEEKWLRITDDRELTGYRFVALNQKITRAQRFQELIQKQPPVPTQTALQTAAGNDAPIIAAGAQQLAQQLAEQIQQQQVAAQQNGLSPDAMPQQQQPDINTLIMQHPLMQQQITKNQVAKLLVDIVIDEAPETAVLADEQYEKLANTIPSIVQVKPDLAPSLVRTLIQASSLPNKRELLQEFDKGPDPTVVQAQQQAQQLAMALQQVQLELGQTRIQLQQAQTAKTMAEAQAIPVKTQIDAQQAQADINKTQADAGETMADTAIKVDDARKANMPHITIVKKISEVPLA